jgi:hypothetical protein
MLHPVIVLTSGERICQLSLLMVCAQLLMHCKDTRFVYCSLKSVGVLYCYEHIQVFFSLFA